MPTTVIAQPGDTLCSIAMSGGFLDCAPLRSLPENASLAGRDLEPRDVVTVPDITLREETRPSQRRYHFELKTSPPISLRFVHGSPDKPYREDFTTTVLGISNYRTDRSGANLNQVFPTRTRFDPLGHEDEDAFKMEVVDPAGPATVNVTLEARKPVYGADGRVTGHEAFTGAELGRRSQTVRTERVPSAVCYRSPYLRLVVDEEDKRARNDQTLLVTDMTTTNGGADDKVEILDQRVRGTYERIACPGTPKCRVRAEVPVGTDKKRVKLALHILKDPVTGNALATESDLRRSLLMYMRQVYAQADLSIKILGPAREIVAPANMIVVDDIEGRRARGGGTIRVRVRIDPGFNQVASIVTVANATCAETAAALATAIRAIVPAGTAVREFANPAAFGKARGSADVVVGDPLTQTITVTVEASGDARQRVRHVALVSAGWNTGDGNIRHVGAMESRLVLNNYDTGRDRVDVFVVGQIDALGLAFLSFRKYARNYGHGASRDEIANSFLVRSTELLNEPTYTTIPHEIGHVLTDAVHVQGRRTEVMAPGPPPPGGDRAVDSTKRITANRRVRFDDRISDVPVNMFRDNVPELFAAFEEVVPPPAGP